MDKVTSFVYVVAIIAISETIVRCVKHYYKSKDENRNN